MTSSKRDRAESVRHRLRNRLRGRGDDVQFGLQRYARERFLYRLGESKHRSQFVLKGATLFALWGDALYRATRDLDFTGYGSPDQADVLTALREVCEVPSPGDTVVFDPGTLEASAIRDEAEYAGLRVRFEGQLGASRIPMQIDIGFGDAMQHGAEDVVFPTLLDDPAPRIRAYPREAVIAEKLHAMAVLGERNSRYKDFYDVSVLASRFRFDGGRLAGAVAATFDQRHTTIDASLPAVLGPRFFTDATKAAQWRTYLERNTLQGASSDFTIVGEQIQAFLDPIWSAIADGRQFFDMWPPAGPWTPPGLDREGVS